VCGEGRDRERVQIIGILLGPRTQTNAESYAMNMNRTVKDPTFVEGLNIKVVR